MPPQFDEALEMLRQGDEGQQRVFLKRAIRQAVCLGGDNEGSKYAKMMPADRCQEVIDAYMAGRIAVGTPGNQAKVDTLFGIDDQVENYGMVHEEADKQVWDLQLRTVLRYRQTYKQVNISNY